MGKGKVDAAWGARHHETYQSCKPAERERERGSTCREEQLAANRTVKRLQRGFCLFVL
jgi:hypothetical protein